MNREMQERVTGKPNPARFDRLAVCSYGDEKGEIDVVSELTGWTGTPVTINYNGRQIVLPRTVALYVCLRLLRLFRNDMPIPASALTCAEEDECRQAVA